VYLYVSGVDRVWEETPPNGRAFCGEPSEQNERPERKRGRRVRCNAMLGRVVLLGLKFLITRLEQNGIPLLVG
jgi:hypothetical protein